MRCPCKDCDHRKVNCHGQCDGYQDWKKYNDGRRKWLHEQNAVPVSETAVRKNWKNMAIRRKSVTKISKDG